MKLKILNLKNQVMMRVYLIACQRLALHTITLHTAVILLATVALFKLVSVHNVLLNFLSVPLMQLPLSIWHAFTDTDFIVVLTVAVFMITLMSLRFNLAALHHKHMRTVSFN